MKSIIYAGPLLSLVLLTACGGGGGEDSPSTTQNKPINRELVVITSANAQTAAGTANTASESLITGPGKGNAITASLNSPRETSDFNLIDFARQQSLKTLALQDQSLITSTARTVTSDPVSCAEGSTNTSADDNNTPATISDDTIIITFNNCTEAGIKMNGKVTTKLISVTGDPNTDTTWSMNFKMEFNNFSWSDAIDSGTINGEMSLDLTTQDNILLVTATGSTLTVSGKSDSMELTNYTMDFTENTNTLEYSYKVDGKIMSTLLGGVVNIKTTTPFLGLGIADPHSGVMVITGANNSHVTGTAIDSSSVKLDIDADGDGIYEETKTVTWDALAL
jgi:hypothetical protein